MHGAKDSSTFVYEIIKEQTLNNKHLNIKTMKIYMIYDYSNMHANVVEEQDFNDSILSDFEKEAIQNLKVGSCWMLGDLGQIDYMITRVN